MSVQEAVAAFTLYHLTHLAGDLSGGEEEGGWVLVLTPAADVTTSSKISFTTSWAPCFNSTHTKYTNASIYMWVFPRKVK